jgi:acyl carrier protein
MVEDKLYKIIADILDIEKDILDKDKPIEDIPNWDSLAYIRILAEIEEQFKVEVPLEKALEVKTISDLLRYIA